MQRRWPVQKAYTNMKGFKLAALMVYTETIYWCVQTNMQRRRTVQKARKSTNRFKLAALMSCARIVN
eukprot:scaffold325634_cov70-Tisochrysis_lutea.AAC.1